MTIYAHSSALVKLVTPEAESDAFRTFLRDRDERVTTSALARTEVVRAVALSGDAAIERARQFLDGIGEVVITRTILDKAAELAPQSMMRSLDAIHLATALELGAHISTVVTYDRRFATAAGDVGLLVVAPGET
jgi:hypothetical protein